MRRDGLCKVPMEYNFMEFQPQLRDGVVTFGFPRSPGATLALSAESESGWLIPLGFPHPLAAMVPLKPTPTRLPRCLGGSHLA